MPREVLVDKYGRPMTPRCGVFIYSPPVGTRDAARLTGICRTKILQAARAGKIHGAVKHGNKWLFPQRSLLKWAGFNPDDLVV